MTETPKKNLVASVRQRLYNKAQETGRPFGELLQYFAMERFLYRLSQSPYAEKFILKGALMLVVWKESLSRPTLDIDLLGRLSNDVDSNVALVKEVCTLEVEPDGLVFDARTVKGEKIVEEADYEGVRVRFRGSLGSPRISMQVDMGFGDELSVPPVLLDYPTILDFPAPRLLGYHRETGIAEKLEAMVRLGSINSRMKDFFDIWLLSRHFDFEGNALSRAIKKTFDNRQTEIPAEPVGLTATFAEDATKQSQWRAFLRKSNLSAPDDLRQIVREVAVFLGPLVKALAIGQPFNSTWYPPGPWV